jgi:hypothetical protein
MSGTMTANDLAAKNRRVVRILLGIVAALVTAAFLVGIRW